MSNAIEILHAALQAGMENRPVIGGFPYLAETLRKAGVTKNLWFLPALQIIYLTDNGPVVDQMPPLLFEMIPLLYPSFSVEY